MIPLSARLAALAVRPALLGSVMRDRVPEVAPVSEHAAKLAEKIAERAKERAFRALTIKPRGSALATLRRKKGLDAPPPDDQDARDADAADRYARAR
jgi:hypothetical protein